MKLQLTEETFEQSFEAVKDYHYFMWNRFNERTLEEILVGLEQQEHYYDAPYIWDKWLQCSCNPATFWSEIDGHLQKAFVKAAVEYYNK